jgi:hypothetical protein
VISLTTAPSRLSRSLADNYAGKLMKFIGSLVAWLISGAVFGALGACAWANLGCAPSRTWKPFLTQISAALCSVEFSIIALAIGAVVYFGFRKPLGERQGFSTHLMISSAVGAVIVAALAVFAFLSTPNWNCTLPAK